MKCDGTMYCQTELNGAVTLPCPAPHPCTRFPVTVSETLRSPFLQLQDSDSDDTYRIFSSSTYKSNKRGISIQSITDTALFYYGLLSLLPDALNFTIAMQVWKNSVCMSVRMYIHIYS